VSEVGEQPQAANDGTYGGVLHHGTYEEDGLVTWEALVFPRVIRSDGEPVIHLRNWRVRRRTCWPPSLLGRISVCPEVGRWQGELEPRPKEARESEGCIRALTSGNLLATRTRPSKGGPC
jgi:hypothetical protein